MADLAKELQDGIASIIERSKAERSPRWMAQRIMVLIGEIEQRRKEGRADG